MSVDFTETIDEQCGTTNNYTALSIFSASSTSILMILSIPLNALVVFVLIKDRKQKRYKSLFYKLLLNIAIADLLTGLVADPNAVNTLVKEALRTKLALAEVYLIHLSLFFTDAVALCTLTLLSIDRIIAILSPVRHFQGMRPIVCYILVASTWIFGVCLVLPYFKIGFIRQLFIFSIINITVTVMSLIVTIIMYRIKLKPIAASVKVEKSQVIDNRKLKAGASMENLTLQGPYKNKLTFSEICDAAKNDLIKDTNLDKPYRSASVVSDTNIKQVFNNDEKPNIEQLSFTKIPKSAIKTSRSVGENFVSKQQVRIQKKATQTFLIMLCVFAVTYLPTAVTMIFMNVCTTCNCMAVHIMRDVSIISILSSSVLRPLNFILTLRHLRSSVLRKIGIKNKKNKGKDDTTTSISTGAKVTSNTYY